MVRFVVFYSGGNLRTFFLYGFRPIFRTGNRANNTWNVTIRELIKSSHREGRTIVVEVTNLKVRSVVVWFATLLGTPLVGPEKCGKFSNSVRGDLYFVTVYGKLLSTCFRKDTIELQTSTRSVTTGISSDAICTFFCRGVFRTIYGVTFNGNTCVRLSIVEKGYSVLPTGNSTIKTTRKRGFLGVYVVQDLQIFYYRVPRENREHGNSIGNAIKLPNSVRSFKGRDNGIFECVPNIYYTTSQV